MDLTKRIRTQFSLFFKDRRYKLFFLKIPDEIAL
jgi:hypothetical protein